MEIPQNHSVVVLEVFLYAEYFEKHIVIIYLVTSLGHL